MVQESFDHVKYKTWGLIHQIPLFFPVLDIPRELEK